MRKLFSVHVQRSSTMLFICFSKMQFCKGVKESNSDDRSEWGNEIW